MAELGAGDQVLTLSDLGLAVTRVVVNQHAQAEDLSEIFTLHTSAGSSLSLTPYHAIFVDGKLAAAADAKVGSSLVDAKGDAVTVKRVTKTQGAVINPVTVSGTILASDEGSPLLAASHPFWIAPAVFESSLIRAVVNAGLFVAGDVSGAMGFATAIAYKIGGTVAIIYALSYKVKRSR